MQRQTLDLDAAARTLGMATAVILVMKVAAVALAPLPGLSPQTVEGWRAAERKAPGAGLPQEGKAGAAREIEAYQAAWTLRAETARRTMMAAILVVIASGAQLAMNLFTPRGAGRRR